MVGERKSERLDNMLLQNGYIVKGVSTATSTNLFLQYNYGWVDATKTVLVVAITKQIAS